MAIEAGQFTEKDELIAKFYTIRAGLSVISEEWENTMAKAKEVRNLESVNLQQNRSIKEQQDIARRSFERNERSAKEDLEKKANAISYHLQCIEELKQEKVKAEAKADDTYAHFKWKPVLFVGIAGLIITLLFVPMMDAPWLFLLCLAAFLVVLFLSIKNVKKEGKKNKAIVLSDICKQINACEENLEKIRSEYAFCEQRYNDVLNSKPLDIALENIEGYDEYAQK